jgi:hypothetical protein
MKDPAIKVVGFGPIPMPSEKKRHREAARHARHLLQQVKEIEMRNPRSPRFKPLEVLITLQPNDPLEQTSVEDLSDDAGDRLIEAIEKAGFTVIEWRTRAD